RSRLQRLEELESMAESGTLESESKKQASRLKREMRKIKTNLEGIRKMSRLPGIAVVIDAENEYIALNEARKLGIFTIAIIDTDSDPNTVDIAIPANDDSIRAIELILNELTDAVALGKTMVSVTEDKTSKPRTRSRRAVLARAEEPQPQTVAAEASEKENSTPSQTQEQNTQ
ncbi:MAG: 30S ribosomal protein S2, partial [Planctomycetota bacterium]